jgi:splicing factor U2AF 65 kDa subunit
VVPKSVNGHVTGNEGMCEASATGSLAAGNSGGIGNAVVNVYINYEKKFAFVEVRTVEEASNCMALDGIMFEGVAVRIRRPNDYNPAAAAKHGPPHPNPNLNLAAVNLTAGGMDSEDRVRA